MQWSNNRKINGNVFPVVKDTHEPFRGHLKTALDQINYIAKTETVIGEPIHAGT